MYAIQYEKDIRGKLKTFKSVFYGSAIALTNKITALKNDLTVFNVEVTKL